MRNAIKFNVITLCVFNVINIAYAEEQLDQIDVVERIIVASRGRNPSNPSDRTTGAPTEQRLEPNSEGLCNTLTSVQKDNYVLEIRTVDDG